MAVRRTSLAGAPLMKHGEERRAARDYIAIARQCGADFDDACSDGSRVVVHLLDDELAAFAGLLEAVPPGFALVPIEPTPEMLEPFARQWCSANGIDPDEPSPPHGEYPSWYEACSGFDEQYRAMLSSSPQAQQSAAPVVPVAELQELERHRERCHNLHLFLSSHQYLNDVVTIAQVLENWKTDDEQFEARAGMQYGSNKPGALSGAEERISRTILALREAEAHMKPDASNGGRNV